MAANKYGKYIIKEPIVRGRLSPQVHICGEKHLNGSEFCPGSNFPAFPNEVTLFTVSEPGVVSAKHAHDYDELLYFIGGNPMNFYDFGAEAEISLGEEDERHLVNTTTIIYVPKGLMHCPIYFHKVTKAGHVHAYLLLIRLFKVRRRSDHRPPRQPRKIHSGRNLQAEIGETIGKSPNLKRIIPRIISRGFCSSLVAWVGFEPTASGRRAKERSAYLSMR